MDKCRIRSFEIRYGGLRLLVGDEDGVKTFTITMDDPGGYYGKISDLKDALHMIEDAAMEMAYDETVTRAIREAEGDDE